MSKPMRSGAMTTVYMRMSSAQKSHSILPVPVGLHRYHGSLAFSAALLLSLFL